MIDPDTSASAFASRGEAKPFLVCTILIPVLFAGALLSPPFILEYLGFVPAGLRITLNCFAILLCLACRPRLDTGDLVLLTTGACLLVLEITLGRSKSSNILSYYAVILTVVLLFAVLKRSPTCRRLLLSSWILLGYFLSVTSIVLFVVNALTSLNTDFLGLGNNDVSGYDYQYSIFGVSQIRQILSFNVTRVYSYFVEAQNAGFYFTINIMAAMAFGLGRNRRLWLPLNILAGALTFSTTFFIAMSILLFRKVRSNILLSGVWALIVCWIAVRFGAEFRQYSSLDDRLLRLMIGADILLKSSVTNLWVGNGVNFADAVADRGVASGFLVLLVDRGILGLGLILSLLATVLRRNYSYLTVCLLWLAALNWNGNYIYWIGILALWAAQREAKQEAPRLVHRQEGSWSSRSRMLPIRALSTRGTL